MSNLSLMDAQNAYYALPVLYRSRVIIADYAIYCETAHTNWQNRGIDSRPMTFFEFFLSRIDDYTTLS